MMPKNRWNKQNKAENERRNRCSMCCASCVLAVPGEKEKKASNKILLSKKIVNFSDFMYLLLCFLFYLHSKYCVTFNAGLLSVFAGFALIQFGTDWNCVEHIFCFVFIIKSYKPFFSLLRFFFSNCKALSTEQSFRNVSKFPFRRKEK